MGGGNSRSYRSLSVFALFPSIGQYRSQFYSLGLKDADIAQLYNLYSNCRVRVEDEKNGTKFIDEIDHNMLVPSLGCGKNAFIHEVLNSIVDSGSVSGNIANFRDFVLILWQFMTIGDHMSKFIFDVYDKDSHGKLTNDDAQTLVMDIYGDKYSVTNGLKE
mmetsp:Transcript_7715/g.11454  ORF Transcript_7715/g.11454 Transcript_7715/m.11454 type:complete len:161 (+) Transcript_7715:70-552(+)